MTVSNYEKMQERVVKACKKAGHKKVHVVYSAYEKESEDNLDEIPCRGEFQIIAVHHSDFWGKGKDYVSESIRNPTWLDIAVHANASIPITGDHHHIYLEGIRPVKKKKIMFLCFGS